MLTICSYNIHGYNNTKTEYIKALLNKCQILLIQEHWLNGTQLDRFSNTFSCSSMHGKTSIDTSTLVSFQTITENKVLNIINKLKNKNSISISNIMLKRAHDPLILLINQTLSTGISNKNFNDKAII